METRALIKRSFVQATTVMLVLLVTAMLIYNGKVVLTIFGGVLFAILFYKTASWLGEKTKTSAKIWLPVTIIAPFLILSLFLLYTAPKLVAQSGALADRLPQAGEYLEAQFAQLPFSSKINGDFQSLSRYAPKQSTVLNTLSGLFSSTLDAFGSVAFTFFLGVFLAISPQIYINGLLSLLPPAKRARSREVLDAVSTALSGWLMAKIASMIIVGIFTTAGLWLLDIDLALILGILAALLSFIPNIGPVMAFIPAGMISALEGFDALLYVFILYVTVQFIESYILTPILQKEIVNMPPALTLVTQIILAGMTGMTGILLAAPLTAALMVITKMVYIESYLEAKSAHSTSG